MNNKGEYICNGYIRTSNGIIETKAYAKVRLIDDVEPFNSDRPYYCEVEYEDEEGTKWQKKVFANDPFSAFELGIKMINAILSFHPGFNVSK